MDQPTPEHDVKTAVAKVCFSWLCVLASLKLADWALVAGIFSALMAGLYTLLQIYVLWRDKLRNRHEDRQGPPDSPAAP